MRREVHSSKAAVPVILLLLVALPLAVAACGAGSGNTGSTEAGSPAGEVQLAMSTLTRLTPAASQTDVLSAAASMQAFGVDLYRLIAQEAGEGNLVFSPSSIVTALAMTYAGAAGTTAQEMAATLHFTLEGDALHQAFNSLDMTLESRSFQEKDENGKDVGVLIKTANSLWGQKDTVFDKIFLDTLAANYGAGIRLVDYKAAAEEARRAINQWVASKTNDKIPELVPSGTLDAMTRLVLVNAIYLDATWMSQFDPKLTADGQFTTLAGDQVTASMMTQEFSYPYATGDGWQAVELPYLGGKVGMLLIVPDQGHFTEVESKLAGGLVDDAVAGLSEGTQVSLTMPKFKFRTQVGLGDDLVTLGMKSAFDQETANFSGMTTQEKLFISDVIHEAYIAVDEEGTEAAAATAVVMRATAMPMEPVQLTIDRPFLFALRDLESGAILFLGRVTDPTK
jgi:serpin B